MEEQTIEQQWLKLNSVRAWIAKRLGNGSDITDNAMFEAQQAIGFAMLHLERTEYLTSRSTRENGIFDK